VSVAKTSYCYVRNDDAPVFIYYDF
jgi:hypothetical protein